MSNAVSFLPSSSGLRFLGVAKVGSRISGPQQDGAVVLRAKRNGGRLESGDYSGKAKGKPDSAVPVDRDTGWGRTARQPATCPPGPQVAGSGPKRSLSPASSREIAAMAGFLFQAARSASRGSCRLELIWCMESGEINGKCMR